LYGLCPVCLLRQGLAGDEPAWSETGQFTGLTDGPVGPGVLAMLTEMLAPAGLPHIMLRDSEVGGEPFPLVQPSSPEIPPVGDRSGRLQLLGEIARGGMGAVLKGRDPDLGRDLAVKVLLESHRDKPALIRRFIEEAQIGGQLQHPGIVPIYELGTFADRRPYFAMKLVKGRTLSSLLDERPEPAHELLRFLAIFESVCQTIAYAHSRGVIHRDLKPSNIIVGSFGEVQVMDWGLAKVLPQGGATDDASAGKTRSPDTMIATARSGSDSDLSQAGSVLGTPSYMAPEQARGEIDRLDERCDVFALGSILCEILTGEPAFTGRSSGEIQRKASRGDLTQSAGRLDSCGVDAEVIGLAKDCLAPELEDRPRHAGTVAERINTYQTGVQERLRRAEIEHAEEKARAVEATKRARVERHRLRLTIALAASLLGFFSLCGGGWAYLAKAHTDRRAATERVVTAAFDEATLLRGFAKAAAVGDLSKWPEAIAAAKKARGLLAAGENDSGLQARVETLLAVLEKEQAAASQRAAEREKDRKFIERLDGIRLDRFAHEDPDGNDADRRIDAAYAAAFREFGIDVENLDPVEANTRLKERSAPSELIFFVDDWAMARSRHAQNEQAESWRRLVRTAKMADPDSWRISLREQIGSNDQEPIRRLLTDENVLSTQPATSLYLLGRILETLGDYEAAEQALLRAWRSQPDDFATCYELGLVSRSERDALRFSTAAVSLRPTNAWAHATLAQAYLPRPGLSPCFLWYCFHEDGSERMTRHGRHRGGRQSPALPLPDVEMQSWAGPSWRVKPEVIVQVDLDHAIKEYREAIRLNPGDSDLHNELAEVLMHKTGAVAEAVEEYHKAFRLAPENAELRLWAANGLVLKGRTDLAKIVVEPYQRRNPNDIWGHMLLGTSYHNQGRKDLAFREYREAFINFGCIPSGVRNFCKATGTPIEVLDIYREAILRNPNDVSIHSNFVEELIKSQRFQEAIAEYLKEIDSIRAGIQNHRTTDADVASACNSLGYLLLDYGELETAFRQIREAVRIDPRNSAYLDSLGWAQFSRGELKEALANLRQADHLSKLSEPVIQGHLKLVERLAGIEGRLDAILHGRSLPADAEGKLDVAELCRVTQRAAASARFFREAFRAKPALAEDLSSQHRLHAAIAAAHAGTDPERVTDDPTLDDAQRSRWRDQALEWLRAEKDACAKIVNAWPKPVVIPTAPNVEVLAKTAPAAPPGTPPLDDARKPLNILANHRDLACVRNEDSLKKFPEAEQKAWRAFWTEVAALLKKAGEY
jgi:serine/threonine-protein kinase